jgi:hypothetical protein
MDAPPRTSIDPQNTSPISLVVMTVSGWGILFSFATMILVTIFRKRQIFKASRYVAFSDWYALINTSKKKIADILFQYKPNVLHPGASGIHSFLHSTCPHGSGTIRHKLLCNTDYFSSGILPDNGVTPRSKMCALPYKNY